MYLKQPMFPDLVPGCAHSQSKKSGTLRSHITLRIEVRSKNSSHCVVVPKVCTNFPSSEPPWSSCCKPAVCTGCPTHHSLVGDPLGEHLVESPALPQNRAEHKGCPNAQHGQSHLRANEDRSKSHSGTFLHLQHLRPTEDRGRKWASLNVPVTQIQYRYITLTWIHNNCNTDT